MKYEKIESDDLVPGHLSIEAKILLNNFQIADNVTASAGTIAG